MPIDKVSPKMKQQATIRGLSKNLVTKRCHGCYLASFTLEFEKRLADLEKFVERSGRLINKKMLS